MDIKIAQQETITELVLENQKLKQERDEWRKAAFEITAQSTKSRKELEREFIKAMEDASQLSDRLSGIELRTTEELARLEQSRDEWAAMCGRYKQERDEAQKQLSSIHHWIDKNHADGFIDSLTYFQNLERVTDNWYDRLDRLEVEVKRFVRERDEARHKLEICMAANSDVARIARERDEAREQVNHYRDKLDLSPISWDI
jgi:hypothetical protein